MTTAEYAIRRIDDEDCPEAPSFRRGVIAIILRPEIVAQGGSSVYSGKYSYFCLDHNGYQHDDRRVKAGIGLMSETYEPDDVDIYDALARSYVEEIMGCNKSNDPHDEFEEKVATSRAMLVEQLQLIGHFNYEFNYSDPTQYTSHPDTCADVMIFVDDDCIFPVGPVQSEEVCYTGYLGRGDLDNPYIRFRTGYNTRHLLETPELADILASADIEIVE